MSMYHFYYQKKKKKKPDVQSIRTKPTKEMDFLTVV